MDYPDCLISQFEIVEEDKFRSSERGVNKDYDMVRVKMDIHISHWRLLKNIIKSKSIDRIPVHVHLVVFEDGWECKVEEAYFDPIIANQKTAECNGFDNEGNELDGPYTVCSIKVS